MYRLLIVDDEPHVVNFLTMLFEEQDQLNLEILSTCTSHEAIEIMQTMKIDIALLDIHMPGLTGLDVFERIRAGWPQVRVIFLTGYNNFDSLYQINRIKNTQFLLKTEDDQTIVDTVASAIESIDKEKAEKALLSLSSWQQQVIDYLNYRAWMKDVLSGKDAARAAKQAPGKPLVLDISRPVLLANVMLTAEHRDGDMGLLVRYGQHIKDTLNGNFHVALTDAGVASSAMLLQPSADWNLSISPIDYIREYLNDFITGGFLSQCRVQVFVYHAMVEWSRIHAVWTWLCGVAKNLSESSPTDFGLIVEGAPEYPPSLSTDVNILPSELIAEVEYALNRQDSPALLQLLSEVARPFASIHNMQYLPAILIFQQISNLLIACIERHQLQGELAARQGIYAIHYPADFADWGAAFDFLKSLASAILALMKQGMADYSEGLVQRICAYVGSHCSEPISLTNISNHLNYNSSYISRVFKQKTGMSVSTFIAEIRIQRAKDLLLQTNESVQSISAQTGFDSPHYFAIVFKKNTGVTPTEYRSKPKAGQSKQSTD